MAKSGTTSYVQAFVAHGKAFSEVSYADRNKERSILCGYNQLLLGRQEVTRDEGNFSKSPGRLRFRSAITCCDHCGGPARIGLFPRGH